MEAAKTVMSILDLMLKLTLKTVSKMIAYLTRTKSMRSMELAQNARTTSIQVNSIT
jgi:hypothetical protein